MEVCGFVDNAHGVVPMKVIDDEGTGMLNDAEGRVNEDAAIVVVVLSNDNDADAADDETGMSNGAEGRFHEDAAIVVVVLSNDNDVDAGDTGDAGDADAAAPAAAAGKGPSAAKARIS